ncbi:hypothetical protein HK098_006101 [Nowakowskiella sp. JEL0407]|nr:hypothetical protein HK098_006101 [Nowakowskiella sp. JEL0407]
MYRALDLYGDGKLKIFPVLVLEKGETEFDFGGVSLSDVPAKDCCRSPKEIWDAIRKLNVFKVDFTRINDLRVLDHEITQLCPVTTAISKRAVISGQIKNPRNCIGRDGVLSAMANGLSDPSRSAAILIYGGPGMGKTTVASRYVHNLKESGSMPYTHVLWISLFSDETFEEDIKRTRELLGIPDDDNFDRLKRSVFGWFAENSCYLVILDNVDAVSIADKHLDELIISGHAIITSRNPTMDEFIPLGISEERIVRQEINTWSKDVTKAYVYSRLKPRLPKIDSEVAALDRILDFVDGYPLVVEQLCSFLLYARHRSFRDVLEQVQSKDAEIWEHIPSKGASHFRKTLDATFKMVIDFLVDSGQTSACVLLGAIGCVANKDIPIHSYLKEYLSQAGFDANTLDDSLNTLFSISLIGIDDEHSFVSVHLAVQDVVRRKLMHTDYTAAPFPDLATLALNAIFPRLENDTYSLQNLTLGKTLLPLVSQLCKEVALARDRNLADLCYSGSELAKHSCSYNVALALNSVAIDMYIEVNGGRENVYVGDAIYLQGRIYDDQGDYENATKQYNECLEIYEKVHGTRVHASVANCMVCLGLIADAQGDYDKAIKLYSESLEIYEKVYGTRVHASVADTINNLDAQGDYNKAIQLYSESLEIKEKVYGTREHDSAANTIINIGLMLYHQRDLDEAEQKCNEGLRICEKIFSNRANLRAGYAIRNLGLIAVVKGNIAKGEKLISEALETFEKLYGKREHNDIAYTLYEIGLAFEEIGNLERARTSLSECVAIYEKIFGAEHPMYLKAMKALEKVNTNETLIAKVKEVTVAEPEPVKKKKLFGFSFKKRK